MALVAYSDESDYDEGDSETEVASSTAKTYETNKVVVASVSTRTLNDGVSVMTDNVVAEAETDQISDDEYEGHSLLTETVSKISLFASVPLPAKTVADSVEEEAVVPGPSEKELEAVKALEEEKKKLKETKSKGKVRIVLPSLTDYSDEELQHRKEKPVAAGKSGSGLLSMLPQPKQSLGKELNRPLIPNSLMKPRTTVDVKKTITQQQGKPVTSKPAVQSSRTDSDEEAESSDFFSLTAEREVIDVPPVPLEDIIGTSKTRKRPVSPTVQTYSEQQYTEEVYTQYTEVTEPYAEVASAAQLDNEALMRLHGKRARRGEPIQFKEVSEDSIRPDPKEWLKQISVEKSAMPAGYSASKKDGPDAVSRRKHQMTYLVHQAKAREVELKNQWANNRQTKRQTQSKYGF